MQLAPGDMIYLYTDGVTEAINENDELYGEPHLLELLNANVPLTAGELCTLVKADVDNFAGSAPQYDDITMLCLTYKKVCVNEEMTS